MVVVDDGGDPFSRGGSLNRAFTSTAADVVVACDADLIVGAGQLQEAIRLASSAPGMVVPFDTLVYCNRVESAGILAGRVDPRDADGHRWRASPKIPCLGGCNVLSRDTWERSGGWLPAFRAWGCEDVAFAAQCGTLVAPTRRIVGDAVHLYHPKTGEYAADDIIARNGETMRRVLACEGDPDAMRRLIDAR